MGKPAARATDIHTCPMITPGTPPVPHVGGPIIKGSANVFIGGLPAATVGDRCTCVGSPDTIVQGSSSVFINGKPAARMGDSTSHGGVIIGGDFTVLIGDASGGASSFATIEFPATMDSLARRQVDQIAALSEAAKYGALGCEQC